MTLPRRHSIFPHSTTEATIFHTRQQGQRVQRDADARILAQQRVHSEARNDHRGCAGRVHSSSCGISLVIVGATARWWIRATRAERLGAVSWAAVARRRQRAHVWLRLLLHRLPVQCPAGGRTAPQCGHYPCATPVWAGSECNLPVAGIDLRQGADECRYCFEVNPSPAFTCLDIDLHRMQRRKILCNVLGGTLG
jgi:hypothetical protein